MKIFNNEMLGVLIKEAKVSSRLRANSNIHAELNEPVQRLFIAMEPGSYVRPHCHLEKEKWEFFMVVRGKLAALFFDKRGEVRQRIILEPLADVAGFEIPPNTWHTILALESGSVFVEVKQGPYMPLTDKDFAAWAPKEGDPTCEQCWHWLAGAQVGDVPPDFV